MCLVFIVLAIISYSVPFYSPTTLQHASRLDSKTLLTKFIWTIFSTYGGRFFPFFIFGWPFFSVDVFSYIPLDVCVRNFVQYVFVLAGAKCIGGTFFQNTLYILCNHIRFV